MTTNELKIEVSKFYRGYLDTEKALKLFELEYGYTPDIEEDKVIVNESICYKLGVTPEEMTFMKQLQKSGVVNMMMCGNEIQMGLSVDPKHARHIHSVYISNYTAIYFPEELI